MQHFLPVCLGKHFVPNKNRRLPGSIFVYIAQYLVCGRFAACSPPVGIGISWIYRFISQRFTCIPFGQEIDELVMMGEDTRIFHTAALEPTELDDYCEDESPALQVSENRHLFLAVPEPTLNNKLDATLAGGIPNSCLLNTM